MRLLDLPDALRDFGVEPVLVAGWATRGLPFEVDPVITLRHWTAGALTGKSPSLRIVTEGRSDLPGPLCQILQERTGGPGLDRALVVASGRANHAGVGAWQGILSGNRQGTGNEIEWAGPHEAFPSRRKETSERIAAALLSLSRTQDGKYACEHREYALPPGRKVDTNLSGAEFRLRVQQLLVKPEPKPEPPKEENDMPAGFLVKLDGARREVLQVSSAREVHWVRSSAARKGYQIQNTLDGGNDQVCTLEADNPDPNMVALRNMVVNLPFVGAMPEGYVWKGPHIKT